jgi:penicillin-binding protein 1A
MSRRERNRRRRRKRGHPIKRVALMTALLVSCGLALAVMGIVGWVVGVADSAPNISQLKPRNPGQISEVYAANGQLLGYISSNVLRSYVSGGQIPNLLRDATVAIEDRRFYHHGGVDYEGILRAGVKDLLDGATAVQGGSTLTMQLVGNVYEPDKFRDRHNLQYKIVQAKLANELEDKHSKAWILTQYLNDVPYGNSLDGQTLIGVGAAAQTYFDKPASKLDLAQMALLAGLPQAPSQYNPFRAPGPARQRRNEVLQAMVQSHYITQQQADRAGAAPLQVVRNDTYQAVLQPYVFDYVKQQLAADLPQSVLDKGGYKVYTTINLQDQAYARQAILAHEGGPGQPAAAMVSIDPTNGNIVAMAQSTSYSQTNFDYATQSQRQTGSSFKPFVLMTLIHDYDGNPNATYYDSHYLAAGWLPGYPDYSVHTSEDTYQGVINVTKAMTLSDNTVFAQLGVDLGMTKVDAMAHAMGITSPLFGYPAEAIGGLKIGVSPLQMSDAYATMADGGVHRAPTIISKVVFPDGSVDNLGAPAGNRVFSDGEAYAADQVLETVITEGTGTAANYGCQAAGKTGTTSNFTDAWFVGYTSKLSTAVWVGYPNDTASMADGYGGTLAAPIWHDFMLKASDGYCGDFAEPTDPWQGVPYIGAHSSVPTVTTTTPTTTSPTTTSTTPTTTNQYNNPTLFSQPPQGQPTTPSGPHTLTGTTNSPPPGFGTGHSGTGGAGVKGK